MLERGQLSMINSTGQQTLATLYMLLAIYRVLQ